MIKIRKLAKTYKNGTKVLFDINLDINDGEFIYVTGPTGSGKSTLIKILDGEEKPTRGEVLVNNINVGRLKNRKIPNYRHNIGVVFQDFKLLPSKTVFENIAYALEVLDYSTKDIRKRVKEMIKLVGLDGKAKSFPRELSGGQQQRVAIARALANNPKLLIADEPTGNLDPVMSNEIIALLEEINKVHNTTILVVTHDMEIVKKHPKRQISLLDGYIASDSEVLRGEYEDIFKI